jgi:hypothetical protein
MPVRAKREIAAVAGVTVATIGLAGYPALLRRKCLTWGAREHEVAEVLPGDDLLPDAGLVTTRAITVQAPPEAIWPWLVQMGSGRGGAYTYDWIQNLFGLNMHNATEIMPRFQDLKAGDDIPLGGGKTMRVEVLDLATTLAVVSEDRNWVWIFALVPDEDGSTRLISRNRIATAALPGAARVLYLYFMEPGSLLMERKMLLGIKQRAEGLAAEAEPADAEPARA